MYNLEKDPKETRNIVNEEQVKAKEFQAVIEKHILWEEKMRRRRATLLEKKEKNKETQISQ